MKEISIFEQFQARETQSITRYLTDLYNARKSPRAVVMLGHGIIEIFVNTVLQSKLKHGKKFFSKDCRSYEVKLQLLRELEVISETQFGILNKVRKIRNDITHVHTHEVPIQDLDELSRFFPPQDGHLDTPSNIKGNVLYLHDFRLDSKSEEFVYEWFYVLVTDFWHAFGDILIPEFYPIFDPQQYSVKGIVPPKN